MVGHEPSLEEVWVKMNLENLLSGLAVWHICCPCVVDLCLSGLAPPHTMTVNPSDHQES